MKIGIPEEKKTADQPEIKPRFNLRLRDRKKNNQGDNSGADGYQPTGSAKVIE